MKIVCPANATHNFQAPENWSVAKYGECTDLPVRQEFAGTNLQDAAFLNTSAWKPTAEDLVILNAGGHLEVTLMIPVQCPIRVTVPPLLLQRDTYTVREATLAINEHAHGDDHGVGTYDEHGPATP